MPKKQHYKILKNSPMFEREREGGVMKGRREKASVLSDFIFLKYY